MSFSQQTFHYKVYYTVVYLFAQYSLFVVQQHHSFSLWCLMSATPQHVHWLPQMDSLYIQRHVQEPLSIFKCHLRLPCCSCCFRWGWCLASIFKLCYRAAFKAKVDLWSPSISKQLVFSPKHRHLHIFLTKSELLVGLIKGNGRKWVMCFVGYKVFFTKRFIQQMLHGNKTMYPLCTGLLLRIMRMIKGEPGDKA